MRLTKRLAGLAEFCVAFAVVVGLPSLLQAQDGPVVSSTSSTPWILRYLCICPPCCSKPLPQLPSSCYRGVCDVYCPKPLPCLDVPCLQTRCDDYQIKPEPCCLPRTLCPPCFNRRKGSLIPY